MNELNLDLWLRQFSIKSIEMTDRSITFQVDPDNLTQFSMDFGKHICQLF